MSKSISKGFSKKYAYGLSKDYQLNEIFKGYQTPSKMNTIQSKHTEVDISNANFSIQSSRIANETEQMSNVQANYQNILRQKFDTFEFQTSKILQKKQREIYFLTVQLKNYESRYSQSEEINLCQREEITRLRNQIQKFHSESNLSKISFLQNKIKELQIQNSKLKQSLDALIKQRNQSWNNDKRKQYSSVQSSYNTHNIKRQVEDLRSMIAQMEHSVKNCPSCFTLKRQNQQLTQAYNNLQSIYNELNNRKVNKQKDLLQNITIKIQENQNILRENASLRQKSNHLSQMKAGRQKFKESVAKRCRTLTDQF